MTTFAVSDVEVDRSQLKPLTAAAWIGRLGFREPDAWALDCDAVVDGPVIACARSISTRAKRSKT